MQTRLTELGHMLDKTVTKVDYSSVNILVIEFSDNSFIEIEVINAGNGLLGFEVVQY